MSTEAVKDRIRKLLNVAKNDASTEGEIDNALRAARYLLHANNLEESDIGPQEKQPEMVDEFAYTKGSRFTHWEQQLALFCGKFIGGVGVYVNPNTRSVRNGFEIEQKKTLHFYGEDEGVAMTKELYTELSETIATLAYGTYYAIARGDGREYCEGFVKGLWAKMKEADHEASKTSTGTALVSRSLALMTVKEQNARNWLEKKIGKLAEGGTGAGGGYSGSSNALAQGYSDGKSQDLSRDRKPKLGATRTAGLLR